MGGSLLQRCCCTFYRPIYCNGGVESDIIIPTNEVTEPTYFTVSGDSCSGYYVDETFDVLTSNPDPDNVSVRHIDQTYEECVDITIQCNDCNPCSFPDGKIPRWMRVHVANLVPCSVAGCTGPTSVTVDLPYVTACRWAMDLSYTITGCSGGATSINGEYLAYMEVVLSADYVGVYWGMNADCNNVISWGEYFDVVGAPSPPDCDPFFTYSMTADSCGTSHCFQPSGVCFWLPKAFFRLTDCSGDITITAVP